MTHDFDSTSARLAGARSIGRALPALVFAVALIGCAANTTNTVDLNRLQDPGPPQGATNPPPQDPSAQTPPPSEENGVGHRVLLWLPNRIFDVLDIVRARLRVGPGFSVGARATELVDVNVGGHATLFVGVPGPRGKPRIQLPFGLESFAGVEVSVADLTQEEDDHAPHYGLAEFGAGFQLLIIGIDIGVEPFEAFDFLAGIFLFDPIGDDY